VVAVDSASQVIIIDRWQRPEFVCNCRCSFSSYWR